MASKARILTALENMDEGGDKDTDFLLETLSC